jgi:CheY-like chemotaxis protein
MSFCKSRQGPALLGGLTGTVQLWVESGLWQAWKTAGSHSRGLRKSMARLLHKRSQPTDVGWAYLAELNMPGMDGCKMRHTLRTSPDMEQKTIVVVSGLARSEVDVQSGISSTIEILPKPVPFPHLLAIAARIGQPRITGPLF